MGLDPLYVFDTYVVGKSNELATAAAWAIAEAPGKVYNPLFIYGDTGLGKTHLMHAIAHEIVTRKPDTRITLHGTEQFTNELVAAIQNRTTPDFRRRFRETDLLLVDDVHFLQREGSNAGGVLPHLQCAVRERTTDHPHQRPAAVGDPRSRGTSRLALSVGHGR